VRDVFEDKNFIRLEDSLHQSEEYLESNRPPE